MVVRFVRGTHYREHKSFPSFPGGLGWTSDPISEWWPSQFSYYESSLVEPKGRSRYLVTGPTPDLHHQVLHQPSPTHTKVDCGGGLKETKNSWGTHQKKPADVLKFSFVIGVPKLFPGRPREPAEGDLRLPGE